MVRERMEHDHYMHLRKLHFQDQTYVPERVLRQQAYDYAMKAVISASEAEIAKDLGQ